MREAVQGLDVLLEDAGNVVAVYNKCVVIQLRSQELPARYLAKISSFLNLFLQTRGVIGFLAVVMPGAPPPTPEQRDFQKTMTQKFIAEGKLRMAVVTQGDDARANSIRTLNRMVMLSNAQFHASDDVDAGIAWIAAELAAIGTHIDAPALAAAVGHLTTTMRPNH